MRRRTLACLFIGLLAFVVCTLSLDDIKPTRASFTHQATGFSTSIKIASWKTKFEISSYYIADPDDPDDFDSLDPINKQGLVSTLENLSKKEAGIQEKFAIEIQNLGSRSMDYTLLIKSDVDLTDYFEIEIRELDDNYNETGSLGFLNEGSEVLDSVQDFKRDTTKRYVLIFESLGNKIPSGTDTTFVLEKEYK